MKKRLKLAAHCALFNAALLLLGMANASAQTNLRRPSAYIGLRAGMGIGIPNTDFSPLFPAFGKVIPATTPIIAFQYALPIEFVSEHAISWVIEPAYTAKVFGTSYYAGTPQEFMWTHGLSYFELPVMAKFKIGGNFFHAYLMGGPDITYLREAVIESNSTERPTWEPISTYNRWGMNLKVAAGASLGLGNFHLFAEARIQKGLTDAIAPDSYNAKFTSYLFSAGFSFPIAFRNQP